MIGLSICGKYIFHKAAMLFSVCYTFSMGALLKIMLRSAGTTSLMLLSLAPIILRFLITSQRAMRLSHQRFSAQWFRDRRFAKAAHHLPEPVLRVMVKPCLPDFGEGKVPRISTREAVKMGNTDERVGRHYS